MSTRTLTSQTQHTLYKWYVDWLKLNIGFVYSFSSWFLLAFYLFIFFLFSSMDVIYCTNDLINSNQSSNNLPDLSGSNGIQPKPTYVDSGSISEPLSNSSKEVALADPYLVDTSQSTGLEYHLEVTGNVNDVITTAGHAIKTGLDIATHTPGVVQGVIAGSSAGAATGNLLTTAAGLTPGFGVLATSVAVGFTVGTLIANADLVVSEINHITNQDLQTTSPATTTNPFLHDFSTNMTTESITILSDADVTLTLSSAHEIMSISTFFG